MPATNVTTAITAATPITTPSRVSTERSLFAHSDCSAMRMASSDVHGIGRRTSGLGRAHLESMSRTQYSLQVHALPPHGSRLFGRGRRQTAYRSRAVSGQRFSASHIMNVCRQPDRTVASRVFGRGRRGKSELRRAVCRITSGTPGLSLADGKCHRKHTARRQRRGKGEKVR